MANAATASELLMEPTDGRALAGRLAGYVKAIADRQDRQAFIALFGHFAPRVKSFMMRGGASAEQADDLVQETMMTVWRKAPLYDPAKASPGTWVFTIARNRRIDSLRRDNRPTVSVEDVELVDDSADAEDRVAADQTAQRIRAMMAALPPDQAQVIQMSFLEDLPHPAIAEKLGLPLGTVKSRLRLAFKKARDLLGDDR